MENNMFLKKNNNRNNNIRFDNNNKFKNKKNQQKELVIVPEDFPEISKSNKDTKNQDESSVWKETILKEKEKEKEKEIININNPKYWRENIWIGPILMKAEKNSKEWCDYIEKAQKGHASSIIFPHKKVQYSRDNKNWYDSLDETFPLEQLEKMNNQKEQEYIEDLNIRMNRAITNSYNKRKEESIRYYEETGDLDDFALAEIEREEYEKYAAKFELDDNDDENEINEIIDNENIEDDY